MMGFANDAMEAIYDAQDTARRAIEQRDELVTMVHKVIAHEPGIVHLFNSMGEASPAAFSNACEEARALLATLRLAKDQLVEGGE